MAGMRVRASVMALVVMVALAVSVVGATPASAAPANDAFIGRIALASPSSTAGTAAGATSDSPEPPRDCSNSGSPNVWYRYTAPAAGTINLTIATATDQGIEVYTGASLSTLVPADCVDWPITGEKHLVVDAVAGTTYSIAVSAWQPGEEGPFTLDLIFASALGGPPPNDAFAAAQTLTTPALRSGDLTHATLEASAPTSSCADERGAGTAWYRYTPTTSGVLHLTVAGAPDLIVTQYTGSTVGALTEVTCMDGPGEWDAESARFGVTKDVPYSIAVSGWTPIDEGPFALRAKFGPAPAHDNFANRKTIAVNGAATADSANATVEAGEPAHDCADWGTGTVWLAFTAPADGTVLVTLESDTDQSFAVYKGSTLPSLGALTCRNAAFGIGDERDIVGVSGGAKYAVAVAPSTSFDGGPFRLVTAFTPAPGNDDFAARTNVKLDPLAGVTVTAKTAGATLEAGEAAPTCAPASGTVWYRFKPAQSGTLLLDASSERQAVVRVLKGQTLAGLNEVACLYSNDGDSLPAQIPVVANKVYAIAVSSYLWLEAGDVSLSLTLVPVVGGPLPA